MSRPKERPPGRDAMGTLFGPKVSRTAGKTERDGEKVSEDSQSTPGRKAGLTPPCHHKAPPGTSDAAAQAIAHRTPELRRRVLAFIRSRGPEGATDAEGAAALGMASDTYRPRRVELRDRGLVRDSGERRATPHGRPAAVWLAEPSAARETGGA